MKIEITGIDSVECIGEFTDEYVYDVEMEDPDHTFFANNILVHNSNYLSIKELLQATNTPLMLDGKINPAALVYIEEIDSILNKGIAVWAKKSMNSADPRFVFKREAICDVALFLQKKRYILNVRNDEGVDSDKMKFVGMEVARSSYSKPVKDLIKKIVKSVFESKNNAVSNKVYRECFDEFKKLSLDDIAIRMSIKDYDKWAGKSKGFNIALHTPIHVKGSIYFNTLLDQLHLSHSYEKITSGKKIKWFYTEKNKFQISAISYGDVFPDEMKEYIKPDYKEMFNKLVSSSVERIFEACMWRMDDLEYEYQTDLFDFFSCK